MKPTLPIFDPAFRYIPSAKTDLRATFAKERKRLKAEADALAAKNVTHLRRTK